MRSPDPGPASSLLNMRLRRPGHNQGIPMILLKTFTNTRLWFLFCALVALVLIVALAVFAPAQVPVAVYKLCLLLLAAVAGFCVDRALFPYAEPSGYLKDDWRKDPDADNTNDADYPIAEDYCGVFVVAMLRQALIVAVAMLAVGLGL